MLGKFLPREQNFFLLFRQAADKLVKAAEEFRMLVNNLPKVAEHAEKIHHYEREGDEVALLTFQLLHKTFITPFDRNDIHTLTVQLDDILDRINRLAQRFVIYQFAKMPPEFLKLTELHVKVIDHVRAVLDQLGSLKNLATILQICFTIDQLENEAETILLEGISNLFAHENDFKQLLKSKEVFEHMKVIINACQDAANWVKSMVLEYA